MDKHILIPLTVLSLLLSSTHACFNGPNGNGALGPTDEERGVEDVEAPGIDPEMQGSHDAHELVKTMCETTTSDTMQRFPDDLVDGVPADVIRDLSEESLAGDIETPPWMKDTELREMVMKKKTSQTSQQIFMLMGEMSMEELFMLPWDTVGKGLHAEAFNNLPTEAISRMPWKEIWPFMTAEHAKQIQVHALKAIHPTQFSTISPEVLGGFDSPTFGEIPIESLNYAPAESFQYVTVDSWRQLGPRKFSVLREDILTGISKQTYEELGRSFLSRVEEKQLAKIQEYLPNLSNDKPPEQITETKIVDERTSEEKLSDTIAALTEVTKRVRIDKTTFQESESYPLDENFIYNMPTESVESFSLAARKSMPANFWERRERKLQSIARQMFKYMTKEEYETLQWEEVTTKIWSSSFNSMTPDQIDLVPWDIVFSKMSGEQIKGLTPRTVSQIEAQYFSSLTKESFSGLSKNVMRELTEEQITSISAEAWSGLTAEQFEGIETEYINKLDKETLEQIDWTTVVTEMKELKKLDSLDSTVIESMEWEAIFEQLSAKQLGQLGPKTLENVPAEAFSSLDYEEFSAFSTEAYEGLSEEQVQALSTEIFEQMTAEELMSMGDGIFSKMSEEQIGSIDWAEMTQSMDFNTMSEEMLYSLPPQVFESMSIEKLQTLNTNVFESISVESLQAIKWEQLMSKMRVTDLDEMSDEVWSNLPNSAYRGMTLEQFKTIKVEKFEYMSWEQLHSINSEYYKEITVEQLHAIGTTKLEKLSSSKHTSYISKEVLIEAGDGYVKAAGRSQEINAHKEFRRLELLNRLTEAITQTSGETVMEVFSDFQDSDYEALEWEEIMREMKAYQINSLSEEVITKVPFEKVWVVMTRSTLESISVHTFEKIDASKFAALSVEQIEFLDPNVVGQLPVEHINSLSDESFSKFTGRHLIRMTSETFSTISVERLNLIEASEYKVVGAKHWEALGEEKYNSLNVEIQESVSTSVRKQVSFMKEEAGSDGNEAEESGEEEAGSGSSSGGSKSGSGSGSEEDNRVVFKLPKPKHRRPRPPKPGRRQRPTIGDVVTGTREVQVGKDGKVQRTSIKVRCISRTGCRLIPN